MKIIQAMFNKRPIEFSREVKVSFIETLTFYGQLTVKTGDQLFSDNFVKQSPVDELIFHVFNFEDNGVRYEFKVRDDKKKYQYSENTEYVAHLHSENVKAIWFEKEERIVYLWEPDDEDDEDWV